MYVALMFLLPCALFLASNTASDAREEDALAAQAEQRREALKPPPPRKTPLVVEVGEPRAWYSRTSLLHLPGEVGSARGLDVTITDATCEPDEVARHVGAQAPAGEHLCLATSTWRNTGARVQALPVHHAFVEVELEDGFLRALTRSEQAWSFAATAKGGRPADVLSPGDEATVRTVVAVPKGSLPLKLGAGDVGGPGPSFVLPLEFD